jgi:hypothetical protein
MESWEEGQSEADRAFAKKEKARWLRRMGQEVPKELVRTPARLKLEVSLDPETIRGLDELGKAFGDTRRGRVVDRLVKDRLAVGKAGG